MPLMGVVTIWAILFIVAFMAAAFVQSYFDNRKHKKSNNG